MRARSLLLALLVLPFFNGCVCEKHSRNHDRRGQSAREHRAVELRFGERTVTVRRREAARRWFSEEVKRIKGRRGKPTSRRGRSEPRRERRAQLDAQLTPLARGEPNTRRNVAATRRNFAAT